MQKAEVEKHATGLDALVNPSVAIKVLSESTEGYDRDEKFKCYRTMPSLEQYVLLSSTEKGIETFSKQDEKHWQMTPGSGRKSKNRELRVCGGVIYRKVFLE